VSPTVALLVLGSAFLHAAWNAVLKRQPDPEHAVMAMMGVAALSGAAWACATTPHIPVARVAAWSIAAGVFEAGYFVTLARALSRAPLGPVYTLSRGTALLTVWPISVLWLGERVSIASLLGTVLVGSGLAAVGLAGHDRREDGGTRGFGWALVCALFIAAYHLAYKQALDDAGTPTTVVAISLGAAVLLNLARLGRTGSRHVIRALATHPSQIVCAGLVVTLSFSIFLHALAEGGAGATLTLRNTSVLFAQGFGLALGERPRPVQWGGACLVALGAVVLAWP
jgi:drug/metabolite transporter (DMT)-like permease